ncbi:Coenzyme PQQ synthesis protein D (PqqD) [Nocardia amikacinitolerans]|uniref:Coenzyme PQQ synthesis protein D (PqqD) n=1 Tax=Nocardia amikacinitolerans TaxID=756689 RepID=A0A285KXU4_9NOCA|nr:lasso peptide biosynthesis PqqD family chaperone [Nocardia amikacinitolerans]MCP2294458.1 Coenzyme PQQ synthesis protein D (PqqD) [Nocardia amikacinitolerans]SNY77474.1 Coenzyme PQQ synthesis protein D (PqqD) [Nocardia amikacinitolerans]
MPLTLRRDVSAVAAGARIVLLDERSGRYWQLNETGTLVMRALLDGAPTADAALLLAERYRIPVERATDDITALLHALETAGLIGDV